MPESSAPRWRRRKQARPAEIAAAALDEFIERGFAAAKLDDVAKRAGVSKGTLYLYFKSKEDLLKGAISELAAPNVARMETFVAAYSGAMRDLLRQVLVTMVREFLSQPIARLPKLMVAEAANFPDVARHLHETVIERALDLYRQILTRGIDAGEFRAVDVNATAYLFQSQLLFLALWTHTLAPATGVRLDPEHYTTAVIDILLHGLAPMGEATGEAVA